MNRIYYPHKVKIQEEVCLDKAASHHLLNVLRFEIGERLEIFNGLGGYYTATLQKVEKKLAIVSIDEFSAEEKESPLKIYLGQAISKGERMDYAVQKAVELGVANITPIFTQHAQIAMPKDRLQNRIDHWQKIAIGAAEQCGRCCVPKIESPQRLEEFIRQKKGIGLICTPGTNSPLAATNNIMEVTLLIGPEGGFSAQEIEQANLHDFIIFSLGPRTLRTETATVVALSLLQQKWGDILF